MGAMKELWLEAEIRRIALDEFERRHEQELSELGEPRTYAVTLSLAAFRYAVTARSMWEAEAQALSKLEAQEGRAAANLVSNVAIEVQK